MERIVNYIIKHGSKEKPVPNKIISSSLNTNEVTVRKEINKARCEGIPICSSVEGYWYSNDNADIPNTIQSLIKRTTSVNMAVDGMLKTLKRG